VRRALIATRPRAGNTGVRPRDELTTMSTVTFLATSSGAAMPRLPRYARAAFAVACLVLSLVPTHATADGYPERTIRLVTGVGAGGHDNSTRLLAEGLSKELGVPVIVDSRPGADGIIGVREVTSAPPDGYTLLSALGSQVAINPATFASLPYDTLRDLAPVSLVARQPLLVAVHPSLPVATLKELVDYTRAHPGTVNYSTATGTFMLAAESLKRRTGADMLHIPYSGGAPALTALVSGTVQVSVIAGTTAIPQAKAGKIRALAVSGASRLAQLPDVPTFTESGIGEDVPVWSAVFAPAGTPRPIVDRIHAAIVRVLATPATRDRFIANSETIVASTPEELAATVVRDTAAMKDLVRAIGLPLR
jgi:tripartite-type tricarboxylate transporter receptor subunit TctC